MPGLGLAPDLGEHLVIAPYAAALALVVAPREACANLAQLERLGYLSFPWLLRCDRLYGEAQPAGQPAGTCTHGRPCKIVMAHHSGMTLLALSHALLARRCRNVFCGTRCAVRTIYSSRARATEHLSSGPGNAP